MQKCWLLENSNTISDFTHDNIATILPCSVSLSDFNKSYGIHQLIEILHRFMQTLIEFARILKQVQRLSHLS